VILTVVDLGKTRYADAWELQRRVNTARNSGLLGDILLLTEHHHVYTLGKGGDANHLLASDQELSSDGVDFFQIDRGGDITYHGPGQIVGYPIIDLQPHGSDIHKYLRSIEESIIRTLASYNVIGIREEGMTGVWVGGEKIAAIGVKVTRWITMHGFAFNVATDLSRFGRIIPCGIFHKGVTSLERLLGPGITMGDVQKRLVENFSEVFGYAVHQRSFAELESLLTKIETAVADEIGKEEEWQKPL